MVSRNAHQIEEIRQLFDPRTPDEVKDKPPVAGIAPIPKRNDWKYIVASSDFTHFDGSEDWKDYQYNW